MPTVIVPTAYQGPTAGLGRVEVAASTLRGALDAVVGTYPGLGALLFADDGTVHRFVSLFLNGEAVPSSQLQRAVAETDEIEILAAIAGG